MEQFDEQNPRLSERMLIDATAFLESELARKYPGVEFEMTACVRRGLNQEYDEYRLAPKAAPEAAFAARVWGSAPDFTCRDGYYGVLRAADYESLLARRLSAVEPAARVYATIDYLFGADVTADTPIDRAVCEKDFFAYTWVLLPPGEAPLADRAAAIRRELQDGALWGDYAVYLLLADAPEMTKAEAFERIPANATRPVYSEMTRFTLR